MTATADPVRWIPLARVVREHGFERSGVLTFKADLFSRGGLMLKSRSELGLKNAQGVWRSLKLAAPLAPHGGAWPQATGVLIKVARADTLQRGDEIGIRRSEFPELRKGFYVCDLIGRAVLDENLRRVGTVAAFQDLAPTQSVNAVNLLVRGNDGRSEFYFPAEWITETTADSLRVDNVSEWMLSGREASDEPPEGGRGDGDDGDDA